MHLLSSVATGWEWWSCHKIFSSNSIKSSRATWYSCHIECSSRSGSDRRQLNRNSGDRFSQTLYWGMSRFLGKFPWVLLHFYAVVRFIIGFENASQLTAQKVGKPSTSVLHPPLHILNVGAPTRWKTVELMKVRDCSLCGEKSVQSIWNIFLILFFSKSLSF